MSQANTVDSRSADRIGQGHCVHRTVHAKALAALGSALVVVVLSLTIAAPIAPPPTIRHEALVSETAGDITTIAGNGTDGYSGDTGSATSAEIGPATNVAVDQAGNVIIADASNNRVRVVAQASGTYYGVTMTAGDIYTVAGNGTSGFSGDDGSATSAELDSPTGVAVDEAGNLLIADSENLRIRVVANQSGRYYGQTMTAGYIYTIVYPGFGSGENFITQVHVDASGDVLFSGVWGGASEAVYILSTSTGTFFGQSMTADDYYMIAGNGDYGMYGSCDPSGNATAFGNAIQGTYVYGMTTDAEGNFDLLR